MTEDAAPADKIKPKKLGCFELGVHWPDSVTRPAPKVNWIEEIAKAAGGQRRVPAPGGVEYVFESRGDRSVIIAKRIPDVDVQAVNGGSLRIGPIRLENVDDFFARANYVSFYPFNAFTMFTPQPGAPTLTAVAAIANHLRPLEGGVWDARPIMAKPDIEEFSKARKMRKLTFHGTIRPNGLLGSDQSDSLSDAWAQIGDIIGADVSVRIQMKVRKPSQHPDALRRFKEAFHPQDMADAGKLTADIEEGSSSVTVNLLQHDLATAVELPVTGTTVIEADMVQKLEEASVTMEPKVKETLELKEG
jgi:hypothetical protein